VPVDDDPMRDAKVATARLGAPYGVHGMQAVRSFSGDTEHLLRLREVELRERRSGRRRCCTVAEVRQVGDKVIMRFDGVSAPEQARNLTGWELWVPRCQASMLQPGEFYAADLCRCTVYQRKRAVGAVTNVIEAGGGDMLEVTDSAGDPFLVPFREMFVPHVDIDARRIDLADEFERP
jgi:16S rRNA processing protein RimM